MASRQLTHCCVPVMTLFGGDIFHDFNIGFRFNCIWGIQLGVIGGVGGGVLRAAEWRVCGSIPADDRP